MDEDAYGGRKTLLRLMSDDRQHRHHAFSLALNRHRETSRPRLYPDSSSFATRSVPTTFASYLHPAIILTN
ncbi:uncharacterized protein BO88DRAFT_401431 [Aspergillus vadensis CBS 113365]|uniref:Uncharacterized protein n=1 Tax=Aspergillus vadensis (strain CBS 113365 / IMI 142717 / IBT 24658) TaxID=1448311 RepID=A0A319BND6_ASPVC|nr:hypothetical protein BO88DRAFT_401431 [Aspergillus vadensis CBS 113365]PYH73864.1 hypothetical protein BO88DRAFT_401431 [Aspergillus vadensis CBS 113365]